MTGNKRLFDMASLAEASYSNFIQNGTLKTSSADVVDILKGKDWSDSQATAFLTHFKIVSQQPNTGTGYSAAVFERLDGE